MSPRSSRSRSPNGEIPTSSITPTAASKQADGVTVRKPEGRLSVSILEGRGMKSSRDPYVLCQFQQSEYISVGARDLESDKEGRHESPTNEPSHWIQTKNQSPTQIQKNESLSIQRTDKEINPRWGIEAVL
jgi:protein-serine/threonine kinase